MIITKNGGKQNAFRLALKRNIKNAPIKIQLKMLPLKLLLHISSKIALLSTGGFSHSEAEHA